MVKKCMASMVALFALNAQPVLAMCNLGDYGISYIITMRVNACQTNTYMYTCGGDLGDSIVGVTLLHTDIAPHCWNA